MKKIFICIALGLILSCTVAFAQDEKETESPKKQTVYDTIEMTCPLDGSKVKGYKIKAFLTTGTDRDFCNLYAGQSLYDLWVTCSKSGYCGYVEDFDVTLSPKVKEKIRKEITPNFDVEKATPWDRYRIAAQIYEWRDKKALDIGNTYLRGTYTMRNLPLGPQDRLKEFQLRENAIKWLKKAERKGQFSLAEVSNSKYLIGELYRRNGDFSKAIRYFDDAKKIRNRAPWIDKWIEEQTAKAIAEYAD